MNEIKTICELALDEPGPPLRDPTEALAIARRTTARRNRLRVAGSGIAALAVAGVLVTPAASGWRAEPAEEGTRHVETATARLEPTAPVTTPPPSAHAAPAHAKRMAEVLVAAVPPGFSTDVRPSSEDKTVYSRTVRLEPGGQMLSAHTEVKVAAGGRQGQLMAVILYDGKPAPTRTDLCAKDLAPSPVDAALPCEVITVGDVLIKVTREYDPERGEVISAVRYLDGGEILVSSAQGLARYEPDGNRPPDAVRTEPDGGEHLPPLADPLLSAAQVAALAADPAMLP